MSDRFESNARTVTLLTFLSRITGLLRDAALSRIFGAAGTMDAFFFAFMIPTARRFARLVWLVNGTITVA